MGDLFRVWNYPVVDWPLSIGEDKVIALIDNVRVHCGSLEDEDVQGFQYRIDKDVVN
jgi:hypothetical protein